MLDFIKKNKMLLIISYFVINLSAFIFKVNSTITFMPKQILYLMLVIAIITIIILIGFVIVKHNDLAVHKIFLLMVIPIGIMYLMSTPLFKGNDEAHQWYKAYAISNGHLMSVRKGNEIGDIISVSAKDLYSYEGVKFNDINYHTTENIIRLASERTNNNREIFVSNKSMAVYPFVQMIPQATGIAAGRLLHLNIFFQAMAGRLMNFLFFVVLGCLAIKIIPVKKMFLMAFLLCPKVLFLATTLSGDVATFSVIILFCAYVMSLIYQKRLLEKKDYLFFAIVLPLISVFKIIYFPICFLLLLLPQECFKNKSNRFIVIGSYILLSLLFAMTWMTISMVFLNQGYNSSSLQIKYILGHPITYTSIMLRTIVVDSTLWLLDMIGGYMEYGTHFFLNCFITIYTYFIIYLSFIKKDKEWISNKKQQLISLFIFLAILVLMLTALYVQWTAARSGIGFGVITGVQGRYFIPIILLLIMIIPWHKRRELTINNTILYLLILAWQLPTVLSIIMRNI